MKCPQCNKPLEIPDNVEVNMESYGQIVLSRTLCCGKGVILSPKTVYAATAYEGSRRDDDWGLSLKKD